MREQRGKNERESASVREIRRIREKLMRLCCGSCCCCLIPSSGSWLKGSQWEGKGSVGCWTHRYPAVCAVTAMSGLHDGETTPKSRESPSEMKQRTLKDKSSVMGSDNSCHIWAAAGQRWALEVKAFQLRAGCHI